MPSCSVLSSSICYALSKAMSTLGKSFNLLGSSFDSLIVLRDLRVLPTAGSSDLEGCQAKRVSNCAACVPVCVRACVLRVRACVQVKAKKRTEKSDVIFSVENVYLCKLGKKDHYCAPRRGGALADSLRLLWSKVVCYQPCERSSVRKSVTSLCPSWHNIAD